MRVFFLYAIALALFLVLCLTALLYIESFLLYVTFFRIFILIEYSSICLFFKLNIKSEKVGKYLLLSIIPFFLFSIYDYIIPANNGLSFSFYPQVIECTIFIFVIIYLFYEKMNIDLSIPIYQLPIFWISIAFLIYFSGNFFLFLYSKNFIQNKEFRTLYHIIYGSVTIIKNLFLCVGVYLTVFTKPIPNLPDQSVNLDLDHFNPIDKQN